MDKENLAPFCSIKTANGKGSESAVKQQIYALVHSPLRSEEVILSKQQKYAPNLTLRASVSPGLGAASASIDSSSADAADMTVSLPLEMHDAYINVALPTRNSSEDSSNLAASAPPAAAATHRRSFSPSRNITFHLPDFDLHNDTSVVSFKVPVPSSPLYQSSSAGDGNTISFRLPPSASARPSVAKERCPPVSLSTAQTPKSAEDRMVQVECSKATATASLRGKHPPRAGCTPLQTRRLMPTGRLSRLGRAERVRPERSLDDSTAAKVSENSALEEENNRDQSQRDSKSEAIEDNKATTDRKATPPVIGALHPIREDDSAKLRQESEDRHSRHETVPRSFQMQGQSFGPTSPPPAPSLHQHSDSVSQNKQSQRSAFHESDHVSTMNRLRRFSDTASVDQLDIARLVGRDTAGRNCAAGHVLASASKARGASEGGRQGSEQLVFESLLSSRSLIQVNEAQYLRLGVVGKGGSSKVYRVLSNKGEMYALKRVRMAPKDHRALDALANEINLLSRLRDHPCIIRLVDASVDHEHGLVQMLMELGELDLNNLLAQSPNEGTGPTLSLNFVRYTWEQMLRAVQCVHEERIVHGDLKPANFVFVRGRLKLIDFGIAKTIGNDTTNITRESQIGTVNYMSPEAILDTGDGAQKPQEGSRRMPCMKLGRPSDVWSLGCILYQLIYGKTPFADLNLIQKLHCICDQTYQISFPDTITGDVRDTIRQCLRRDPTQRPSIATGPHCLLQHPFLHPLAPPPCVTRQSQNHAGIKDTVEAVLRVLDKQPDLLRLEAPQRTRAIYHRMAGVMNEAEGQTSLQPRQSPERLRISPQREALKAVTVCATAPRATAASIKHGVNSLTEQIVRQRGQLKPVGTPAYRDQRRGYRHGRWAPPTPGGLRAAFENGLKHIRSANEHDSETTEDASAKDDSDSWSST